MLRKTIYCAILGATSVASANGFYINEHDAKSTGRAGAVVATTSDPSSIVFNPGGIPLAEGTNVMIGGSLYTVKGSYTDTDNVQTKTDTDPTVVPHVYVTSRINELFAAGIGFHLPYGSSISWPDGHAQRDTIQDQSLRTFFITPSVGLNLNKYVPGLSFGGGVDLVPATVKLERVIIFGDTEGSATLGGDAFGVGGRLGVQYRPEAVPQLGLGLSWRSQVNLDFDGDGDFDIEAPFRGSLPPDGPISTSIKLPQQVGFGVSFNPIPELQIEGNAIWIDWSKFKELRIELPGGSETVAVQNYEDQVTLRFGAEYTFPKYGAAVRLGYLYDPTPIPTSTATAQLPDADRHDFTVGGSYNFGDYGVHLGLLYVIPSKQTTDDTPNAPVFKAEYEVTAFVASLSLSGTFGGPYHSSPPPASNEPALARR